MALDEVGTEIWDSGFEPFGRDSEEATPEGALAKEMFLRFPGQWEDGVWAGASLRAEVFYNVHRWYSPTSRYTRPDPVRLLAGANNYLYGQNTYLYAEANPLVLIDQLGIYGTNDCSYYDQRCKDCGGYYYCKLAPKACRLFPSYPDPDPTTDNDFEGWARCTRKCLQDCDANNFERRRSCNPDPCADNGPGNPDPATESFFDESNRICHRICYSYCHYWGTWGGGDPGGQPIFK